MRMKPISPETLTAIQRSLYDEMKQGVAAKYNDFQTMRDDGAFLGPWNTWLHQPELGAASWGITKALTAFRKLPDTVRQVAIIATGAHFGAAYEIYAHTAVAKAHLGMSERRLSSLASGERPDDLNDEEAVGFEVTRALLKGGVLPGPTYQQSIEHFGQEGTNELIWLVGHYCAVSITLNGFDIPVPDTRAPKL